jgi:DNA modification methylase
VGGSDRVMQLDTIVCGDCLDVMRDMPSNSVDAVITDPPYGINFKYDGYKDDPKAYEVFMKRVVPEMERVNKGPIFVWQTMLNCNKWHRWFPDEFRLFAACKGFVQYRPTPIQFSWDPVIFWGDIKTDPSVYKKDYHEQRKAPFGKNRPKIPHPCPRPLEQVMYVVDVATKEDDLVFDPFIGSGTTAVAAIKLGRHFYGCDINENYVKLANERIEKTRLEMSQMELSL